MSCYKRKNKSISITAETEAIKDFKELEPEFIAKNSGTYYDQEKGEFTVTFCNDEYTVSFPEGKVSLKKDLLIEVPELERTIILQYLAFACGLPPRGKWLNFLELPNGEHHNTPFQLEACKPIADTFGDKSDDFLAIGEKFGAEVIKMGDVGFKLAVLPKIDLAFVLWEGDEEFPPRANVLFESVTPTYMTTAWLYCLGIEVAQKFVKEYRGY